MTDDLPAVLAEWGARERAAAGPPPVPRLNAPRSRTRLLPLAAAAAATAVALAAGLLGVHARSADVPGAEPAAAFHLLTPRERDAPPPADPDYRRPPESTCGIGQNPEETLTARVEPDPSGGRVHLTATGCVAVQSAALVFDDRPAVAPAQQVELPTPPRVDVHAPVTIAYRSAGPCAAGRLVAVLVGSARVPVSGSTCPPADGAVTVLQPHHDGTPAALVPAARAGLRVAISDLRAAVGGLRFVVTLRNPTGSSISLSPCPTAKTALLQSRPSEGSGQVEVTRLDCAALPGALGPGASVRVAGGFLQPTGLTGPDVRSVLRWGIAGPEQAEADLPPTLLASVPGSPAPTSPTGQTVPAFRVLPAREQDAALPRDGSTGAPCITRPGSTPSARWSASQRGARVTVDSSCSRASTVDLLFAGRPAVSSAAQPDLPNPVDVGRTGSGVVDYAVPSQPDPCAAGRLDAIVVAGVRIPVTGTGCPPGGVSPQVGTLHLPGEPGGLVPADRGRLVVQLSAARATPSGPRFLVRLTNPTGNPISLRPCPTSVAVLTTGQPDGSVLQQGSSGRLDCEALPEAVPPGGAVTFEGGDVGSTAGRSRASVRWGIAGPAGQEIAIPSLGR